MSERELTEEEKQQYLQLLQDEVLGILNKVKEEMGIDTPVDIEIREVSEDE